MGAGRLIKQPYRAVFAGGVYTLETAGLYGVVGAFDDLLNPLNVMYSHKELLSIFCRCTRDSRLHGVVFKVLKLIKSRNEPTLPFDPQVLLNVIESGTSHMVDECLDAFPDAIKSPGLLDKAIEKGQSYTVGRLLALGVNPNTVDFARLKIAKTVGVAIDVTTLQALLDHGLLVTNEHIYTHCVASASCVDLLINKYGVDMTKTKLLSVKTHKELMDFLDSYPECHEQIHRYMNITFLQKLFSASAKPDIIMYVIQQIPALHLRKNFTTLLKHANARAVYEELFARTQIPFPDYAKFGMTPLPAVAEGKMIKAAWLRSLANSMKRDQRYEKRARMHAICAKIVIDHFVSYYGLPHHLAETIGFMSFITKRDMYYYTLLFTQ